MYSVPDNFDPIEQFDRFKAMTFIEDYASCRTEATDKQLLEKLLFIHKDNLTALAELKELKQQRKDMVWCLRTTKKQLELRKKRRK